MLSPTIETELALLAQVTGNEREDLAIFKLIQELEKQKGQLRLGMADMRNYFEAQAENSADQSRHFANIAKECTKYIEKTEKLRSAS